MVWTYLERKVVGVGHYESTNEAMALLVVTDLGIKRWETCLSLTDSSMKPLTEYSGGSSGTG